jgi:glycerol-3-phosphate cytidylyltransferase
MRSRERVVGYVPGAYDLFHVGHLNILRAARERCDVLIAGVISDEMYRQVRGHDPFVPGWERLEIVSSVRYVDQVHEETTPEKLDAWERLRFDRIFKGDDWRGTPRGDKLELDFAGVGVAVTYLPYTPHTSSTMLRRALNRAVELSETPAD